MIVRYTPLWAGMLLAAATCCAGCTDARLDYPHEPFVADTTDNILNISGEYCTSPAADVPFPVKVMFIVDGSGSQQFMDQNRQRVVAVEETINALLGAPNVYFKVIVFNATISAVPTTSGNPPPAPFTNDVNELVTALGVLAEADTLTDYQGSLSVAYAELLRDMDDVFRDSTRGPAELGRTKYVIIFISDGLPDPQCQAGLGNDFDPNFPNGVNLLCEDQDYIYCLLEVDDPEIGTTVCTNGICQFNDTLCYQTANAATLFGGMNVTELAAGVDYNQPYQVLNKVSEIMALQDRYEVGEIRFHTGLVFDPLVDPAIVEIFGDSSQAGPLMQQMAAIGEGRYLEFYGGDEIDFLEINFDTLKQPRVVRSFFAHNLATRRLHHDLATDSDFDGLTDDEEFAIGTNPRLKDSDGDGYSDFLEYKLRAFGYDPLDPCKPAGVDVAGADPNAACDPAAPMNCDFLPVVDAQTGALSRRYMDADRDGLNDCEERALGTNPRNPDTDHDGVPDYLEFIYGMDPLTWDTHRDDDQDGIANGQEIEWHLHPTIQQSERAIRDRYRYSRPKVGETLDGRPCYEFHVRNIPLAYTLNSMDLPYGVAGYNDVRLYILENLADDLAGPPLIRTACLRPRYVPPAFKQPAGGAVALVEADFKFLPSQDPIFNNPAALDHLFDANRHCIEFEFEAP